MFKALLEGLAQERILTNPSTSALKALAKNNKYGSARFVIYNNGDVVAGDSEKYTHQDIAPANQAWHLRGLIHHSDGQYHYSAMEPYSNLPKDHPFLRKLERVGVRRRDRK